MAARTMPTPGPAGGTPTKNTGDPHRESSPANILGGAGPDMSWAKDPSLQGPAQAAAGADPSAWTPPAVATPASATPAPAGPAPGTSIGGRPVIASGTTADGTPWAMNDRQEYGNPTTPGINMVHMGTGGRAPGGGGGGDFGSRLQDTIKAGGTMLAQHLPGIENALGGVASRVRSGMSELDGYLDGSHHSLHSQPMPPTPGPTGDQGGGPGGVPTTNPASWGSGAGHMGQHGGHGIRGPRHGVDDDVLNR